MATPTSDTWQLASGTRVARLGIGQPATGGSGGGSGGGTGGGTSGSDLPFLPRNASAQLFQPLATRQRMVTLQSPHPKPGSYVLNVEGDLRISAGPTWNYVDIQTRWEWSTPGGDWLDKSGAANGANHWAVSAPTGTNGVEYSVNTTELLQFVQTQNRWCAFILQHGGAAYRTVAGLLNTTVPAPRIAVTYADGSTDVLACKITASISAGSDVPNTGAQSYSLPVMMEFDKPSKPVQSATMHFTVVTHFSGSGGISINPLNPSIVTQEGPAGVANDHGLLDAGIQAAPGVIFAHRYTDGSAESDFVSTIHSSLLVADYDPLIYGTDRTGTPDPNKLPTRGLGKFVNANIASNTASTTETLKLVPSTYSQYNFRPLAPGLGALHTVIQAEPNMADGHMGFSHGSVGCAAKLFMPFDKIGMLQHGRMRYYIRWHFEQKPSFQNKYLFFSSGAQTWVDYSGKFGPGFSHDTDSGGVSNTSGGGRGWQGRMQWGYQIQDAPGPLAGGIAMGCHIKSDFGPGNPPGHNYSADINTAESLGQIGGYGGIIREDQWHLVEIDFKLNTVLPNGLGYVPDGHWRVYLNNRLVYDKSNMVMRSLPLVTQINKVVPVVAAAGNVGNGTLVHNATVDAANTYLANRQTVPEVVTVTVKANGAFSVVGSFRGPSPDGVIGQQYNSLRHSFILTQGTTPFAVGDSWTLTFSNIASPDPACGELGIRDIWLNWFQGGKTNQPMNIHGFITGLVVADGAAVPHIGPMKLPAPAPAPAPSPSPSPSPAPAPGPAPAPSPAPSLPTYVPAPGQTAMLTTANGTLSNTFGSQVPPWFTKFYATTIVTDYSGGVANPYYGTYGSWLLEGAGHAGSSNNSIIAIEPGATTVAFRLVMPGTQIFGGTAADAYQNDTDKTFTNFTGTNWMEYFDGKPAARHSYGAADVIGPEHGGAAHGTFLRLIGNALAHAGYNTAPPETPLIPHKVDFTGVGQMQTYARAGTLGQAYIANMPSWTAHAPAQGRVYIHNAHSTTVRWFNLATSAYQVGTGTGLTTGGDVQGGSIDGYVMIAVPERNILIFADAVGGLLRLRRLPVGPSDTNPSWVNTPAPLSQAIGVTPSFNSIAWVPEISKLLVGTSTDTSAIYEITIPTVLTDTWSVVRAPMGTGQSIPFHNGLSARCHKLWSYLPAIKCLAYFPAADRNGANDTLYLYRPRGT